jgi:hypothetical protein
MWVGDGFEAVGLEARDVTPCSEAELVAQQTDDCNPDWEYTFEFQP